MSEGRVGEGGTAVNLLNRSEVLILHWLAFYSPHPNNINPWCVFLFLG